jgi:prepilin-type N-terminal cleavage/methylation domain-containing protein
MEMVKSWSRAYRNREHRLKNGFTLIELAIALVVIGLIVGGILVGQNLISAAAVRATVTQVEKYNTAANTFREKFGYLPGDIPPNLVTQFGFTALPTRPGTGGQGDGNGVVEGYNYSASTVEDYVPMSGEPVWFWEDLSSNSHLIEGAFNTSGIGGGNPPVNLLLPVAKLGGGNYFYVYSFNGTNYFGLSIVAHTDGAGVLYGSSTNPGLTVQQAYAIDSKVDDGFPQSGNVTAKYQNWTIFASGGTSYYGYGAYWASGGGVVGPGNGSAATPGSATTCYDNSSAASGTPGVADTAQHYSIEISNGANNNCALSFRMQAGD